jgi:UrcA family protein
MKSFNRIVTAAALAVVFAGTVATAQAEDLSARFRYDEKHAVIQFENLSLSNPAYAEAVVSRIKSEARKVCKRDDRSNRMAEIRERAACIEATYAETVAAINANHGVDLEAIAATNSQVRDLAAAGK